MKNIINSDERIVSQKMKIQSDAYQILIYCLLASIIIQYFFIKAPLSQFIVELICLVGMGLYVVIRHLILGIDIFQSKAHNNRRVLLNGLTTGAISVFLLAVLAGERNALKLILFFLCFTSTYYLVNLTFLHIYIKREKQIDDKLNSDEVKE